MRTLRSKLVGGVLAAGVVVAATPSPAQDAAGAPQAGADKCSFLGCLLHSRSESSAPRPEAVAQEPAASPAAAVSRGDVGGRGAADDGAVKTVAKPAPTVTVAADAAEKPRLKSLAAARPHQRLRVVAAGADDAELILAPTLDAPANALPLYSEQLHVLAGPAVTSLADLRDKPVSFGPASGPTEAVARRAFAAAGVAVKETPLDEGNALDGLATGDIAAVVVLAPQPAPDLAGLRAPGLHLVDWPENATLPPGARLQRFSAKSYPRLQASDVHAFAVDAVLTLTPKGERSAAARSLFASLKQRAASLARRGFDRLGSAAPELRQGRAVAKDNQR